MDEVLRQRVVIDRRVMAGKPVIRGTRVPVDMLVRMLSQGIAEQEILDEYRVWSRSTSAPRLPTRPTSWRTRTSSR